MAGFRLLPRGIEEPQFKAVPGGWLFTTGSPWVFAPRRTYLLTDAQKPEIAARARRGRYIRLALMMPLFALMVAALASHPDWRSPDRYESWLAIGLSVVVITVILCLADYLNVQPLLRGLPRSAQKIGLTDMLRRQSTTSSVKSLVIFLLVFLFNIALFLETLVTAERITAYSVLPVLVFTAFALWFGVALAMKLIARSRGSASRGPQI